MARVRYIEKINTCITCGIEFHPRYQKAGKYCSRNCINSNIDHPKQTHEEAFESLKHRFFQKVIKNYEGCWGWNGWKNSGYGSLSYKKKDLMAHRASWIIHNGPIPEGMFVLHTCDNRPCTNPEHLWLGTYLDNNRDMDKKGRRVNCDGEKSPRSLLTDNQVLQIKIALKNGVNREDLAIQHGVNVWVIRHIDNGATWKHIKID